MLTLNFCALALQSLMCPSEPCFTLCLLRRRRALGFLPQPNMAVYYAQRTTPGGLLISEATSVSERGYG